MMSRPLRRRVRSASQQGGANSSRVPARTRSTYSPPGGEETARQDRGDLLRRIAAGLGNVGVLSALLVYFGWVRSEVQAKSLGIDESILGMTTVEYMLRSVRPVLILLIIVALSGLLWALADHWLEMRTISKGPGDSVVKWTARLLPATIVLIPLGIWSIRSIWPAFAFVSFPLSLAAGLLLLLYSFHLKSALPGHVPMSESRTHLLRLCAATLVCVALFSTAANYATVEGTELARTFDRQLPALPRVVVHSTRPLNIVAPGVDTRQFTATSDFGFEYSGLRLLERTGGRYFLVSDGWTPNYGVVIVLKDDEEGVRFDFIRDVR
jgi:hypothetical protein